MDFNKNVDLIRLEMSQIKFKNELIALKQQDNKSDNKEKEQRITSLELIIKNLDNERDILLIDKKKKKFAEIDQLMFKKKWMHLAPFHRLVKIEEYLRNNIKDVNTLNKLINDFTTLINNKKLTTQKSVLYDFTVQQITAIPALILDEKNNTYKIIV